MNGVYLIIGGNLGNRLAHILDCKQKIEKTIGNILLSSVLYETASWGVENQPDYLNQVLKIETKQTPYQLLKSCLTIEKKMGRVREKKWSARIIDIDILFYNEQIIQEEDLNIPHPFLHKRKFVLVPLNEIAPTFLHPIFKKQVQTLLHECEDNLPVKILLDNEETH